MAQIQSQTPWNKLIKLFLASLLEKEILKSEALKKRDWDKNFQ